MTQVGEGVSVAKDVNVEETYSLRFKLVDEGGKPLVKIPYKTVKAGASPKPLHIANGVTSFTGTTPVVSTKKNEEVELYIVWAKLTVKLKFS